MKLAILSLMIFSCVTVQAAAVKDFVGSYTLMNSENKNCMSILLITAKAKRDLTTETKKMDPACNGIMVKSSQSETTGQLYDQYCNINQGIIKVKDTIFVGPRDGGFGFQTTKFEFESSLENNLLKTSYKVIFGKKSYAHDLNTFELVDNILTLVSTHNRVDLDLNVTSQTQATCKYMKL